MSPPPPTVATLPRIRRTSDYRHVVQDGQRLSGRRVTVYWVQGEGERRAGFVVRREIGGAVARNRARRLLREAWRQVASDVSGRGDVVFLARPGIARSKTPEVADEMRELLARAGSIVS